TGSALSAARAKPQTPTTNATERIAFMIASEKWGKRSGLTQAATSPGLRFYGCRDCWSGLQEQRRAVSARMLRGRTLGISGANCVRLHAAVRPQSIISFQPRPLYRSGLAGGPFSPLP